MEHAIFAGGCFWCLDAAFRQLKGVTEVTSGYTGGTTPRPDYHAVCTGSTGHAEAISVTFDPKIITYEDLLKVFFGFHDPTTLNRQGHDIGSQYRSALFPVNDSQKEQARAIINQLTAENIFSKPIVTTIEPFTVFYPAETYHQNYYQKNPTEGYCSAIISPKLASLRKHFATLLKS